jgi:hypothetical protein
MSLWGQTNTLPVDGFSNDPYTNPNQKYDDTGVLVPFTQNPTLKPPIFVCIESSFRNQTVYPNSASFEVMLPSMLNGISSVEVVSLTAPRVRVGGSAPVDPFFYLFNGLLSTGAPQSPNLGRVFTVPSQTVVPGGQGSVAGNCFGQFVYNSGSVVQSWVRSGLRQVTYHTTELSGVNRIQVSLRTSTGTAYDLSDGSGGFVNWTCVLMFQTR